MVNSNINIVRSDRKNGYGVQRDFISVRTRGKKIYSRLTVVVLRRLVKPFGCRREKKIPTDDRFAEQSRRPLRIYSGALMGGGLGINPPEIIRVFYKI